jgi:hypothetical protein
MNLVAEVLDKQLVDRAGCPMGRADGIVLELRDGKPPRLTYIETGPATAARRISPRFANWISAFTNRNGPRREATYRIPWSLIEHAGVELKVNMDAQDTPTLDWERWIRDRLISRIPGA